jgi:hypothetical protein
MNKKYSSAQSNPLIASSIPWFINCMGSPTQRLKKEEFLYELINNQSQSRFGLFH